MNFFTRLICMSGLALVLLTAMTVLPQTAMAASGSCHGCGHVVSAPPAPNPGVPYDYQQCENGCRDVPKSGPVPKPINLTLPGLGMHRYNCGGTTGGQGCLTLTAELQASYTAQVEAGISKILGVSVSVSFQWTVGVGFQCCGGGLEDCKAEDIRMDFGIVGSVYTSRAERQMR